MTLVISGRSGLRPKAFLIFAEQKKFKGSIAFILTFVGPISLIFGLCEPLCLVCLAVNPEPDLRMSSYLFEP